MKWHTPVTWTAGQIVDETDLNSELRNQLTALKESVGMPCCGRLTLTTGVPVTTTDVLAASTVYFTPVPEMGNLVGVFDDNDIPQTMTFSEVSLSIAALLANTNYDVFIGLDSGGAGDTLTLDTVAWASDAVRAVGLTNFQGTPVKTTDTTRRYLGTLTTTIAGQTEDSIGKRLLWNQYNRVRRMLRAADGTDSWTYTTAAYRQANGNAANKVSVVVGQVGVSISLQAVSYVTNSGGAVGVAVGIGTDSTATTTTGTLGMGNSTSNVAGTINPVWARLDAFVSLGRHDYTWLEYSAASGTTTWYGDNASPTLFQAGLTGFIEG